MISEDYVIVLQFWPFNAYLYTCWAQIQLSSRGHLDVHLKWTSFDGFFS